MHAKELLSCNVECKYSLPRYHRVRGTFAQRAHLLTTSTANLVKRNNDSKAAQARFTYSSAARGGRCHACTAQQCSRFKFRKASPRKTLEGQDTFANTTTPSTVIPRGGSCEYLHLQQVIQLVCHGLEQKAFVDECLARQVGPSAIRPDP